MSHRQRIDRRQAAVAVIVAAVGVLFSAGAGVEARWSARTVPGPPPQSGQPALKLYVLDGGTMKERDGVPYGLSREQMPPRDLSDPCVLIVHPRGTLLWETGLNERVNQ